MNTLKKLTALLLVLCLALGAAGCAVQYDMAPAGPEAQLPADDPGAELTLLTEDTPAPAEATAPETEPAPPAEEAPAPEAPAEETPLPPVLSLPKDTEGIGATAVPAEDGEYTTAEDVALYLHVYGHLPYNFMTKNEARDLGWSGGGLDDYAYGMCIGGDRFGNYEGVLPQGSYHECDINTLHARSRGAERLVYSDDGRIYYTNDHYETFTLLYGEE